MVGFNERLNRYLEESGSRVCVGLDPVPERLPSGHSRDAEGVLRFTKAIVDATAPEAAAFKPNSAYFEALGPPGYEALIELVTHIHDTTDVPVILDNKRGDVGHTAKRYADASFDIVGADAVTASPYLGFDAIAPFAERPEKGVFILARTSNQSAAELQDLRVEDNTAAQGSLATAPLFVTVARRIVHWNQGGNLGLVAGATWPGEIDRLREAVGDGVPFLVPGVGAQGGDARTAARAAADRDGLSFLINSGRGIMHASDGADFAAAAAQAARRLREEIAEALAAPKL